MPMEVQMVDGAPAPIFYRDIWHLRWPKILWATLPKIIGSIALPVAGKAKAPKAAPPPIEPAELSIIGVTTYASPVPGPAVAPQF
jgi:hypothetical protein